MKAIVRIVSVAAIITGFVVACKTTGPKGAKKDGDRIEASDLTWKQARERSARVSQVQYVSRILLNETDDKFKGQNTITFSLKDTDSLLRLDHYEGEVTVLKVNGQDVPLTAKKRYWIELPKELLKLGENTVQVDYTQAYSKQGQGLHRFHDPQTKEVFLYSQFETFDANRFMPCFDQPDLKATWELTVEAPVKWEVITTTAETSVTKTGNRRLWKFAKTPPLSTYLFSLHAGPYKVWRDRFEDVPLRIFARPSLSKYVRAQEWFTWTKQGLRFFNSYFAMPYPFKKYDQLFVPEFNAGAMENVGAVTFSENFLSRAEVTREQRRRSASVLLHEMAHMWFGNIVTMKWWNDLWLNETFATSMAAFALFEATEFKEAWQDFFAGDKGWAYWEDSLVTTHPIEAPVENVKQAFATFDGITYGKGAAVVKQLRAYIGPEAFKAGMQDYFKKHAFQNAELKDFIASLQTHTQRDLNLWADRWLRQSGTDKLAAKWTCTGDTLAEVELITTPSPDMKFRPQTVWLGLFKEKGGRIREEKAVHVDLTAEKQIVQGPWACPDLVYPNYQDDGYLAASLDPKSLDFVKRNLSRISDPLLRTMLWHDLWQMVRNTEMPLKDYVRIVEQHFGPEKDTILLTKISHTIAGRRSEEATILHYWPETEAAIEEKGKFVGSMERQFLSRFRSSKAGSDAQKFWFDRYVRIARSSEALNQLAKWAEMPKVGPGFPLDLDRQWDIVRTLARYQHTEAVRLLDMMKKKDTSDRGQRQALAAEAIQPDVGIKQKWVGTLSQPKPQLPFAQARAVLGSLFPVEQSNLAQRFEKDFYEYLKANGDSEDEIYVESFAGAVAPLNCKPEGSTRLKSFLSESESFSPSVIKALKVSVEEDERCQRVRAMSSI